MIFYTLWELQIKLQIKITYFQDELNYIKLKPS